jgi:hypothetical protein
MATVIQMQPPKQKAKPEFSSIDMTILRAVANWRKARAAQQAVWAQWEIDCLHGYAEGALPCDTSNLDLMFECEHILTTFRPDCALAATQMLGVVLDMMAHEAAHPDTNLGTANAFEILKKLRDALEYARGDFRLVPKNAKE